MSDKITVNERTLDGLLTDIQHYANDFMQERHRNKMAEYIKEARVIGECMQDKIELIERECHEMGDGNMELRSKHGARDRETFGAFVERLASERDNLQAEINALRGGIEAHKRHELTSQMLENLAASGEYKDTDLEAASEILHGGVDTHKAELERRATLGVLRDACVVTKKEYNDEIKPLAPSPDHDSVDARGGGKSVDEPDDEPPSYVALPVYMNGLRRGNARLPVVGHSTKDGHAVIVRLGAVEFPLPIDFDPNE